MTNPDYPTTVGDFLMDTYQQVQPQFNNFYYNGMGTSMTGQFQPDSRRNDPTMQQPPVQPNFCASYNPQNPMGSFQALYANPGYPYQQYPTTPMPQMPASEMNIRPFSSYPPEYSVPQNQFNVTDSRRLDDPVQQSPWAQPAPNPFVQQQSPQYMNPNMLYSNVNATPMNRKSQPWDNCYTQPVPTQMPNINWNQTQMNGGMYPQSNTPVYPNVNMSQPQSQTESWLNIAQQNWK